MSPFPRNLLEIDGVKAHKHSVKEINKILHLLVTQLKSFIICLSYPISNKEYVCILSFHHTYPIRIIYPIEDFSFSCQHALWVLHLSFHHAYPIQMIYQIELQFFSFSSESAMDDESSDLNCLLQSVFFFLPLVWWIWEWWHIQFLFQDNCYFFSKTQ